MRILLVHQYFLEKNDGGGSRFNEMCKIWSDSDHEVTVLAGMLHYNVGQKKSLYKGKFTYVDSKFYNNVDVIRCHVSESYNVNFLGRLWGYFSFVISSIFAGVFKTSGKYDLVLVSSPPLFIGITGIIVSFCKKIPLVFEVRDLWPESAIDIGIVKNKYIIKIAYWLEKYIYRKSKYINVLTLSYKKHLLNKGVPDEKIIYIPNSADFSLIKKIEHTFNVYDFREKYNLNNKFVITYVGAHGVANHLIQIIDVAEKLINTNVVFQLIGDGMQKEMLIQECKKRGLNNVIFRGIVPKEEALQYILASDVGISILKNIDTFKTVYSNKTFDYMACKKPILMGIDGASRKLIEEANCGIYVEPENVESIIKGINILIDKSKEELVDMGICGYKYAKRHFDREKLAHRYIELLKR
jgi:glycosyltransferase involved in cell wall biosynthesis